MFKINFKNAFFTTFLNIFLIFEWKKTISRQVSYQNNKCFKFFAEHLENYDFELRMVEKFFKTVTRCLKDVKVIGWIWRFSSIVKVPTGKYKTKNFDKTGIYSLSISLLV